MNELDLPPRRTMPDAVRLELRARLDEELAQPPRRDRRTFGSVMCVVATVAGAVVVAPSLLGTGSRSTSAVEEIDRKDPYALNREVLTRHKSIDLDRCRAAAAASDKAARFPPGPTWRPAYRAGTPTGGITGIWADGKPVFCITRARDVRISLPAAARNYTEDGSLSIDLASAAGDLAGATAADVDVVSFDVGEGDTPYSEQRAIAVEGLFFLRLSPAATVRGPVLTGARGRHPSQVPARQPSAEMVTVVDRPSTVDRSSTLGKELNTCLTTTEEPRSRSEADPDAWEPALAVDTPRGRAVLARFGTVIIVCETENGTPSRWTPHGEDDPDRAVSKERPVLVEYQLARALQLAGRVTSEVRSLTLITPAGAELPTRIANGVFVMLAPNPEADNEALRTLAGNRWRARITEGGPQGGEITRTVPLTGV